eukprot:CAMPEP_0174919708 /NCGR_PEP_ID=MMETSP1355-20121228/3814_1 /TAXON_ID=464990 /ORGANISM="Hemiselmis tepida, Strain CCMP443" /LENGTH=371 /DNA_ID=CAMNT_0016164947 /DNA_START=268 /DNA_END=1379 /DNA_ORIENTATION=+
MAAAATLTVRYSNGMDEEVALRFGSNVLGKRGGPADVTLGSQSLSRRHAMIKVSDSAAECTVEDLGSTNKSAIVTPSGELQALEPGTVYPLREGAQLVMGDVQALFSHAGGEGGSIPSTGHGNRNVMFVKTPASPHGRTDITSVTSGAGSTRIMPIGSGATTGGSHLDHKLVYEHGRADLGMNLPYDSALLWIADSSLQMPLPDGWQEEEGGWFSNPQLAVQCEERPQNVICRNLYKEMKRKAEMESSLGTLFAEEALPRLLVLDPATQLSLFHYILPGRNVVGKARQGVDITFERSAAMSKRHGYLEMKEGRVFAGDLGSTNGTYIGEFPQTESRRLEAGAEVEVHDGQLLLFADAEATLSMPAGGNIVR